MGSLVAGLRYAHSGLRNRCAAAFMVVALGLCGSALAQTAPQPFLSSAPDVTALPGQTVAVTVTFTGNNITYENLDYLAYDARYFSVLGLTGTGRAVCTPNDSSIASVRMFITNGTPNAPITSASCIIQFRVATDVPAGVYPLRFVVDNSIQPRAYCLPSTNNSCLVRDGRITVQGGVTNPDKPPTLAFSATPTFVAAGGIVTLSWSATDATSCTPSGGEGTQWSQVGQLPPAGAGNLTLPTTVSGRITFVLTCAGRNLSTAQSAFVIIGNPPPLPAIRQVLRANPTVDGQRPSGPSTRPVLSSNGRTIVYESAARNLVGGDTNNTQDVFLRDTVTNQTVRVTVTSTGAQSNLIGGEPSVDRNGQRVVMTMGTGLVPNAANAKTVTGGQISMFNKSELRTSQVSTNAAGTAPANGASSNPQISEDGTQIVFRSEATDLTPEADTNGVADVFLFETSTSTKSRLSNAAAPAPVGEYVADATAPKASGPGVNLCSRPAGGRVACEVLRSTGRMDIVVYALGEKSATGTTVSVGAGGAANGDSNNPAISSDGRYVFFDSAASNLVTFDTNGRRDVFRAELDSTGAIVGLVRASVSVLGAQGNGDSERPATCGTGQYVTFESLASNLVAGDDGARDVFARDLASSLIVKLSQTPGGAGGDGASSTVTLSPDCSAIAFATSAENLASGGASGQDDVVAGASPFQATNVTGGWYDLAQAGQGLFVEHLDDERIVASWYTFSPAAAQTWLIGVGTLMGNTVTLPTLLVTNGRFPPAFNPATNTPFGTMTLRFDTCDSGLLTFDFPAPYGTGSMPLRRPELAAGITCSTAALAAQSGSPSVKVLSALPTDTLSGPQPKATGPVAALTGSWANPAQIGHGLQMEVLSGDRLVVAWYVFTSTGEQQWLIGAGPISGQSATVSVVRPTGGRFIPNFNPSQVTNTPVGSLTVTALNCTSARVDYNFGAGFTGSFPITRVTSVRGVPCTP